MWKMGQGRKASRRHVGPGLVARWREGLGCRPSALRRHGQGNTRGAPQERWLSMGSFAVFFWRGFQPKIILAKKPSWHVAPFWFRKYRLRAGRCGTRRVQNVDLANRAAELSQL